MSEFNAPGKVPPALTGTAAYVPPPEQWDPEGDIHLAGGLNGVELYAPTIVRAPPQLPRPEQHPHRHDFPPRGYQRHFATTPAVINSQLGFTAQTVRVDNYSSHWLWFPSAGMWVPPFMYSAILNLSPGVPLAQYQIQAPTGYTDPTPVFESNVVTVWLEDMLQPQSGTPINSSFRVGAAGGANVTGNLLFTPDSTYDIGANAANRPRYIYAATDVIAPTLWATAAIILGAAGANGITGGVGAPSAGIGSNGDYYFRSDTPATSLQRIYVKSAGAWVGVV
jgi:hypothetical protein